MIIKLHSKGRPVYFNTINIVWFNEKPEGDTVIVTTEPIQEGVQPYHRVDENAEFIASLIGDGKQ